MPTYRTSIFRNVPFIDNIPEAQSNLTDYYHINTCKMLGYTVDWFRSVLYLVRSKEEGLNGEGQ
jgi:hypothetical protein